MALRVRLLGTLLGVILLALMVGAGAGATRGEAKPFRVGIVLELPHPRPDVPIEDLPGRPRNLEGVTFAAEEAGYLAGYLAALVEARRPGRDVVSSVGGDKFAEVDRFIAGFEAGAREARPRIVTLHAYVHAWDEPSKAKCGNIALDQIPEGAGVVFQVAGSCGLGALEAAKEKGVFGIGVDADQSALGPHILTSALKRVDVAVYETIRMLKNGTFRSGRSIVFDLRDGGVGLGKISPKAPRALLAQVERVRRQIVAGKIGPIPTTVP